MEQLSKFPTLSDSCTGGKSNLVLKRNYIAPFLLHRELKWVWKDVKSPCMENQRQQLVPESHASKQGTELN